MSGDLLSIDVEAELLKLSLGRLRSRAQAPVALARMAALAGASRLVLDLSRRSLRLEHDGKPPGLRVVADLRTLFDRSAGDLVRHRALEHLESIGMLDLLVAFAIGGRRVELDIGPPVSKKLLVREEGQSAQLLPSARSEGTALLVLGGPRSPVSEIRELVDALRHASFRVVINRKRIDRGLQLGEVLLQTHFEGSGFRGVVGLPRRGLAGITRVLVNGVLDHEVWKRPADGTVWEVVIDLPSGPDEKAALALMRHALPKLYRTAGEQFDGLSAEDRSRVKQLLYRRADFGAGAAAVSGVRLFKTVQGELLAAETLSRLAAGRVVRAVAKDARLSRYELSGPVFVLDEQDRGFVERHLGLLVREPFRRSARKWYLLSSLGEKVRVILSWLLKRILGAKEIAIEELSPAERRFLEALDRLTRSGLVQWSIGGASFVRGRFGLCRVGADGRDTRLLLSRNHPWARAMVKAFERDRTTLYPALMLLAGGQNPFGENRERALAAILELEQLLPDGSHSIPCGAGAR